MVIVLLLLLLLLMVLVVLVLSLLLLLLLLLLLFPSLHLVPNQHQRLADNSVRRRRRAGTTTTRCCCRVWWTSRASCRSSRRQARELCKRAVQESYTIELCKRAMQESCARELCKQGNCADTSSRFLLAGHFLHCLCHWISPPFPYPFLRPPATPSSCSPRIHRQDRSLSHRRWVMINPSTVVIVYYSA